MIHSRAWRIVPAALLASAVSVPSPSAQSLSVTDVLDRYLRGEFDAVVASLERLSDFSDLLEQLKKGGAAWVDAGGPAGARAARTGSRDSRAGGGSPRVLDRMEDSNQGPGLPREGR